MKNPDSVNSLISWIKASKERTANPYLTPLIISEVEENPDALSQYKILNAASEFNQDPILWLKKIRAARKSGLDNYADQSLEILNQWLSEEELLTLKNLNY